MSVRTILLCKAAACHSRVRLPAFQTEMEVAAGFFSTFPVQREDDRKAKPKRLSEGSGSSGPPVKCQRAENQTERVPLRQPDRREEGFRQKKEKRKERGGG